jgi:hypothetical protein
VVSGTIAITLGDVGIEPPAPPETYFGVAEGMLPGANATALAQPASPMAMALICSHILECLLKASLTRRLPARQRNARAEAEVMERSKRHNLAWLWTAASQRGLAIAAIPPAWAQNLSELHSHPYYLRYSTGVNGVLTPGPQPMLAELAALVETVRYQLRQ